MNTRPSIASWECIVSLVLVENDEMCVNYHENELQTHQNNVVSSSSNLIKFPGNTDFCGLLWEEIHVISSTFQSS